MKNLNIFYFDNDLGDFDKFNPRFVMEQNKIKNIVTLLSSKPAYYFNKEDIVKIFNLSEEEFKYLTDLLDNISAIHVENNKFRLNFPFFHAKDVKIIKKFIINELNASLPIFIKFIKETSLFVKQLYPEIDSKLSLYHLLCGKIFDGSMFDYLESEGILKQSYPQKDNRDYMLIGYADNSVCNNFNKNLFCSFNHARYKTSSLSSFGNAYGNRFDYFRYLRLRKINNLSGKFKIIHKDFCDLSDEDIIKNSIEEIKNIDNNQLITPNIYNINLIKTQYLTKDFKICVPVFKDYVNKINLLSNFVFEKIGATIKTCLNNVKSKVLTSKILCINHNVDEKQISNELWHMFFGLLNKFLIDKNLVAKPQSFKGEGKYLKCVYLE